MLILTDPLAARRSQNILVIRHTLNKHITGSFAEPYYIYCHGRLRLCCIFCPTFQEGSFMACIGYLVHIIWPKNECLKSCKKKFHVRACVVVRPYYKTSLLILAVVPCRNNQNSKKILSPAIFFLKSLMEAFFDLLGSSAPQSKTEPFPYKTYVLGFSTAVFLFELYLSWRQHRRLINVRSRTEDLKPLISTDDFRKARLYSLDKSTFGFITAFCGFMFNAGLVYFNVLPLFWSISQTLLIRLLSQVWHLQAYEIMVQQYEISQSLIFLSLLSLANMIFNLPFSLYSTFVIEEKHGFNKQTLALFVSDFIKSTLLSAVIGLPCVAGFLWVVQVTGDRFYVYVWLFLMAIQFIMITIYPTLIQPLFNKITPLPEGALKQKIEALAESVSFPLTKLYVIDGSRRSNHSNAYFYGFFKNKRIVLFDTLLEQVDNHEQILAVLAHEIGHWFHSHTLRMLALSQVHIFCLFYLFSLFRSNADLYESFGFDRPTSHFPTIVSLMLFSFLYSPVEAVLGFAINVSSRRYEFQADAYAARLGYAVELREALIKISVKNRGMMWPDWMYAAYHYSHPPVVDRLARLKATANGKKKVQVESEKEEDGDVDLTSDEKKDKYLVGHVLRKRKE